jgi:dUTP pyrophosphatase
MNTQPITVPVKLLDEHAAAPRFKHAGDGGADVTSIEDITLAPGERATIRTGIAMALPDGYACSVVPRSGLAAKNGITIVNAPGLVDSGYRGEIKVILLNTSDMPFHVSVGDRIAQLVIKRVESPIFMTVDSLDDSERGSDGFGSTGVK